MATAIISEWPDLINAIAQSPSEVMLPKALQR